MFFVFVLFCLRLDGPIAGGLIDRGGGLITGILRHFLMVLSYSPNFSRASTITR